MPKIILHCDMDRFYPAVEEKYDPVLKKIPFAVCGDPAMRHGIVMSASSLARRYGVRAGLRFSEARKLCPNLMYVTADMPKYLQEAKAAREVYLKYAESIVPYGIDESWIILDEGTSWQEAGQIADLVQLEIMYSMELSVSVGISYNLIFAKLGSDYLKPNGITVITRENFREMVWPLDVGKLLFVGEVRKKLLLGAGIRTIGDIAGSEPEFLSRIIKSKAGYELWQYANGDDRNFKPTSDKIESIGNTLTPPADLRTNEETSAALYMLASAVSVRLRKHSLKTKCIGIVMKDSEFNKTTRQCTSVYATDSECRIYDRAYGLFRAHYEWKNPLRSIGIRTTNFDVCRQLMLCDEPESGIMDLEVSERVRRLGNRFGKIRIENAPGLD